MARVVGPAILKDAFTFLLREIGVAVQDVDYRLVLLVGDDWAERMSGFSDADRACATVLVANAATDLGAAQEHGIRVLVHEDEPLAEMRRAVRAAVRGEAYHSPRLLPLLLRTVHSSQAPPSVLNLDERTVRLSSREREIAIHAAAGLSNQEIGERLEISSATVRFHLHNVFQKLGIERRGQLVGYVVPHGQTPERRRVHRR